MGFPPQGNAFDILSSPELAGFASPTSGLNVTQATEILKLLEALQTLKSAMGHSHDHLHAHHSHGHTVAVDGLKDVGSIVAGHNSVPTVKIVLQVSDFDRHKGMYNRYR